MSSYKAVHTSSTWRFDESGLHFIVKRRPYLVIQMKIIANGTQDLCFTDARALARGLPAMQRKAASDPRQLECASIRLRQVQWGVLC